MFTYSYIYIYFYIYIHVFIYRADNYAVDSEGINPESIASVYRIENDLFTGVNELRISQRYIYI
jgi:hypothetical protein